MHFARGRLVKRGQWVYQRHEELSVGEEELLWKKGIMGIECPDTLLNAVLLEMVKFCVYVEGENTGILRCCNSSLVTRNANGEASSYVVYTECG